MYKRATSSANPFAQTVLESFVQEEILSTTPEIERLKQAIRKSKKDIFNWPNIGKFGLDEYKQSYLAAACFPKLFPYATGDFTRKGRERTVSIKQARKYYKQFVDYHDDGTMSYRFAKHHLFSFWIFNMSNRHELNTQTNAFIKNTPSTRLMSREELLAELKKGAKNILSMGLGRYEANIDGTEGY